MNTQEAACVLPPAENYHNGYYTSSPNDQYKDNLHVGATVPLSSLI